MKRNDPFNLQRFIDAQERSYEQACQELRAGCKMSHWMWFTFPQLKGLGHSSMTNHYGIGSLQEARAYLADPILGSRLTNATEIVLRIRDRSIGQIFGYPDDLKFHSCMTLFAKVAGASSCFEAALQKYFGGQPDELTIDLLSRS